MSSASLPTCKSPAGLTNALLLWCEGLEHRTQGTASAGEGPGTARGKRRCPLLLSCTSSQRCSGLGCSSWGARHQIPSPKLSSSMPSSPVQLSGSRKKIVPSLAPGGEGVSSHPSWHSLCPCSSPKSLRSCRLNCLIREHPQLAPALTFVLPLP